MNHYTMKAFLILLISLILAGSLGGCGRDYYRKEYYEMLRVDKVDDGVYMIASSISGHDAGHGWGQVMREAVIDKARDHCAQQNKAMKMMSKEGQGGSSSFGFSLFGAGGSQAGAEFDIVFTCRERTKQ